MSYSIATRLLALCSLGLVACSADELVANPLVDRWCGERPCGWEVEGKIERVGTWNEDDYAVGMTGNTVRLSQVNGMVDASITCFEFSMVTKITGNAKVYVELDFMDDGSAEFSRELRKTDYEPARFLITTPTWYEGVRFIVRKEGSGEAVLARLRVQESTECSAAPVELLDRPFGAYCEEAAECESAICELHRCGECQTDGDCTDGQGCGLREIDDNQLYACVDEGTVKLGDACVDDEVCDSGVCCNGSCSECCDDEGCAKGQSCRYPVGITRDPAPAPKLCGPGTASRAKGAACTDDSDCTSGSCSADQECFQMSCNEDCQLVCLAFGGLTIGKCD